jgi:hypothetical protein
MRCWVYIAHRTADPARCKVGIASDLQSRLGNYLTAYPQRDVTYHRIWRMPDRAAALNLERKVLRDGRAAGWAARGEWLNVPASVVATLIDDELSDSSATAPHRSRHIS